MTGDNAKTDRRAPGLLSRPSEVPMRDAGFQSYDNVLSHSECDALLDDLTRAQVVRGRAGARHLF